MNAAQHAIKAAQNSNIWGRFMAQRYCEKRNVPLSLLRLAKQLEASKGIK